MTTSLNAPFLLLVGLPGSGKSTWARRFVAHSPGYQIVSTDEIRAELYGDEAVQGEWRQVWRGVQQRWQAGLVAIATGQLDGLIYDATNVRRRQRRQVIMRARRLGFGPIHLYWFDVPLDQCRQRNRQRYRQVPEAVMERMARQLQGAPPALAEGVDSILRIGVGES